MAHRTPRRTRSAFHGDAAELGAVRAGPDRPAADTSGSPRAAQAAQVPSDAMLGKENKQFRARIREPETEREVLRRAAKYFTGEMNW